jgi:hypothetical protein
MAFFNRQRTLLDIVQDVTGQLGLPIPQQVNGNVSDDTARQLQSLINYCGRRLIKPTNGNRWTVLQKTWQLTTVPGQTVYDLPVDWDSFVDVTAWNDSSRFPLIGPVGASMWAMLKGRSVGPTTLSLVYRTRAGKFELYFSPSTAQNIRIDYTSRAWVQGTDPTLGTVYKDSMTDDADLCLYDGELITCYAKLRFLIEKGMDTTVALSDFQAALDQAQNADRDAPLLPTGSSAAGYPLINPLYNVPETGYGV